ncbi:hypothetical protein [Candidatus Sneabacter namystus]|uniref:Uncharacterized protein n=1 Tax=Candidatus Sneabacter namystus TaxID=2601646 RepID=A0A5C0UGT6_9RICK|nr:hypothetical protein [Candidatus Sneabacter namystus]QEK39336.1 hypothetical protein FZC37_00025 [Candidatus Sneabacter namystus]
MQEEQRPKTTPLSKGLLSKLDISTRHKLARDASRQNNMQLLEDIWNSDDYTLKIEILHDGMKDMQVKQIRHLLHNTDIDELFIDSTLIYDIKINKPYDYVSTITKKIVLKPLEYACEINNLSSFERIICADRKEFLQKKNDIVSHVAQFATRILTHLTERVAANIRELEKTKPEGVEVAMADQAEKLKVIDSSRVGKGAAIKLELGPGVKDIDQQALGESSKEGSAADIQKKEKSEKSEKVQKETAVAAGARLAEAGGKGIEAAGKGAAAEGKGAAVAGAGLAVAEKAMVAGKGIEAAGKGAAGAAAIAAVSEDDKFQEIKKLQADPDKAIFDECISYKTKKERFEEIIRDINDTASQIAKKLFFDASHDTFNQFVIQARKDILPKLESIAPDLLKKDKGSFIHNQLEKLDLPSERLPSPVSILANNTYIFTSRERQDRESEFRQMTIDDKVCALYESLLPSVQKLKEESNCAEKILDFIATKISNHTGPRIVFGCNIMEQISLGPLYSTGSSTIFSTVHDIDSIKPDAVFIHECSHYVMDELYLSNCLPVAVTTPVLSITEMLLKKYGIDPIRDARKLGAMTLAKILKNGFQTEGDGDDRKHHFKIPLEKELSEKAVFECDRYIAYSEAVYHLLSKVSSLVSIKGKELEMPSQDVFPGCIKFLKNQSLLSLFLFSGMNRILREEFKKEDDREEHLDNFVEKCKEELCFLVYNLHKEGILDMDKEEIQFESKKDTRQTLNYILQHLDEIVSKLHCGESHIKTESTMFFLERMADAVFRKDEVPLSEFVVRYPETLLLHEHKTGIVDTEILEHFRPMKEFWNDYIIPDIDRYIQEEGFGAGG